MNTISFDSRNPSYMKQKEINNHFRLGKKLPTKDFKTVKLDLGVKAIFAQTGKTLTRKRKIAGRVLQEKEQTIPSCEIPEGKGGPQGQGVNQPQLSKS